MRFVIPPRYSYPIVKLLAWMLGERRVGYDLEDDVLTIVLASKWRGRLYVVETLRIEAASEEDRYIRGG